MQELKNNIKSNLNIMARTGVLTPEQLIQVIGVVDTEISSWSQQTAGKLRQMVVEWESAMGDTDESFYSLGIRRAEDVILGITVEQRLPVLEKKDTPDDFPAETR
ncbi:MAG: hypothetical protein ACO38Q_02635 [Aquiluna sp.]